MEVLFKILADRSFVVFEVHSIVKLIKIKCLKQFYALKWSLTLYCH